MLQTILSWIVKVVLDWLVGHLTSAIQKYENQLELDRQRGITDEENIKKYEEAKDRLARHSAASDLLNGVSGSP